MAMQGPIRALMCHLKRKKIERALSVRSLPRNEELFKATLKLAVSDMQQATFLAE